MEKGYIVCMAESRPITTSDKDMSSIWLTVGALVVSFYQVKQVLFSSIGTLLMFAVFY